MLLSAAVMDPTPHVQTKLQPNPGTAHCKFGSVSKFWGVQSTQQRTKIDNLGDAGGGGGGTNHKKIDFKRHYQCRVNEYAPFKFPERKSETGHQPDHYQAVFRMTFRLEQSILTLKLILKLIKSKIFYNISEPNLAILLQYVVKNV